MSSTNKDQTAMNMLSIWGYDIPLGWLSIIEAEYLKGLPKDLPSVNWVCGELDRIWNEQKLDNHLPLKRQPIGAYYSHPVWLMNGIFSACDPVSFSHRIAIAKNLKESRVKVIADYGGGFGQLALLIAAEVKDAEIYIVEPYPSMVGIKRLRSEPRIKFVPNLAIESYDVIVAQDVLEHVEDPIKLASEIASSVRIGGKVIFANCFYPVIQSHLPSTFHLRYTFPFMMKALGLRFVGRVSGASHAQVFERVSNLSIDRARKAESISKLIGPVLNQGRTFLFFVKSTFKRLFMQK